MDIISRIKKRISDYRSGSNDQNTITKPPDPITHPVLTSANIQYPPGVRTNPRDKKYKFFKKELVIAALDQVVCPRARYIYKPDEYDCDNFSNWFIANVRDNPNNKTFHGIAMGEAWGSIEPNGEYHSLIAFWTDPKTIIYYDPQRLIGSRIVNFHPIEFFV